MTEPLRDWIVTFARKVAVERDYSARHPGHVFTVMLSRDEAEGLLGQLHELVDPDAVSREMARYHGDPADLTPENLAELRRTFTDDALERLARSDMDYCSSHGHYIPALARLLLAEKAEAQAALDAERARADKWNKLSLGTANELSRALGPSRDTDAAVTYRENLEAVAEAAREFMAAWDDDDPDDEKRTEEERFVDLRAALAVLEEPQ